MVTVNNVLWRDTFFFCFQGNRYTVFITATNKFHIPAALTEVSYVHIGRYIHTGKVTDMNRSVGIRKGSCNQMSFVIFHGFKYCIFCTKLQPFTAEKQKYMFFRKWQFINEFAGERQ